MTDLDYGRFEALTFDCYGQLIDWEASIALALRQGLGAARMRLPGERLRHVAQGLFHDPVTAKRLGFTTVWIDRRGGRPGGATPPAEATPDATFPDMASFADAATRT